MPQTRKPASPPSRKGTKPAAGDPPPVQADAATIRQALEELGIDRPYMACRVVGNRLELTLYGGDVVTWPPQATRRKKS